MSKLPLILVPPSEGKTNGGTGAPWEPGSMSVDLDAQRVRVIRALNGAMRGNAAARGDLLGVKGEALRSATAANRAIRDSGTMAAIDRYSGVLYGALDYRSLDKTAHSNLAESILIASGLWGLVAPHDMIPDYKLKMGSRLSNLGRLSTWWRASLSKHLNAIASGRLVWNLLPNEHAAAWKPFQGVKQVTVEFLEPNASGRLVAVSHWNKFLKGALIRHLLEHPETQPGDLADWHHPSGYYFDSSRFNDSYFNDSRLNDTGDTTRVSFIRED